MDQLQLALTPAQEPLATLTIRGKEFKILPLPFKDTNQAVSLFGMFLVNIALTEDDITAEVVKKYMPSVLAINFSTDEDGAAAVHGFLNLFVKISHEDLENFSLQDITTLWEKIYETHSLPFELKRRDMIVTGQLQLLKQRLTQLASSSTELVSTQGTEI